MVGPIGGRDIAGKAPLKTGARATSLGAAGAECSGEHLIRGSWLWRESWQIPGSDISGRW